MTLVPDLLGRNASGITVDLSRKPRKTSQAAWKTHNMSAPQYPDRQSTIFPKLTIDYQAVGKGILFCSLIDYFQCFLLHLW